LNSFASIDFILEALENEITLGILELTDLLFLLELVVLHSCGDIVAVSSVFRVEHVSTQIEDSFLINALLVAFTDLLDAEHFHKLTNPINKVAVVDACREALF
jgi:hypothetical protein